MSIMPLGASISAGFSSQNPYNGGGYHTQLYANLVNDGRFTPNFVGSSTSLLAVNPTSPNILTAAGQTNNEGHSGYTTSQILNNLNGNDGSGGNNGGNWLAVGNGINPNYIPLNVGGNDFVSNHTDTQAINRYDAILSQVNSLRSGVDTLATNLMYRTDVGSYVNTYFNPYVQGVVYNHVLAGQNVQFVDLYNLVTPGNSLTNIGSDGVHPGQAGYNLMANIIYNSTIYGAAYWTGSQDGNWNTLSSGTNTNWAMDAARTTDRQKLLTDGVANTYSYADVYFNSNATPLSTTLGVDTTVRSLNFAAGATGSVSVGGGNTLSIGSGGITVQQGTGAHTVSANIALTADQTWGNVSSNDLTVSGAVSGSNNLTIVGSYTVYTGASSTSIAAQTVSGTGAVVMTGASTYTGTTTVSSGKLVVSGSLSGTTAVSVSSGAELNVNGLVNTAAGIALNGVLSGAGTVGAVTTTGGTVSPGNSIGTLNTGNLSLNGGAHLAIEIGRTAAGAGTLSNDRVNVTGGITLASGADLQLTMATGQFSPILGDVLYLVINDSVDAVSGVFTQLNGVNTNLNEGSQFTFNSQTYQISYAANFSGGSANDIALTVVPEPGTWAMLVGGFGVLIGFQRRRKY